MARGGGFHPPSWGIGLRTRELETRLEASIAPLSCPCLPCNEWGETGHIFRELQSKEQKEALRTILLWLRLIMPMDTAIIKVKEIKN